MFTEVQNIVAINFQGKHQGGEEKPIKFTYFSLPDDR